jgi:hypothetical protein
VVANGHIYPQIDRHPDLIGSYAQPNLLLRNDSRTGNLRFTDVTGEAGPGFAERRSHRGLAVGDFDDDGRLDLLLTALDTPPVLLRNEGRAGSWLTVVLEGKNGDPFPIGATVTVRAGGRTQVRDLAAGDSFLGTHDPRPHFGLGDAETAELVEVRWPDGTRSALRDVRARQFLRIRKAP